MRHASSQRRRALPPTRLESSKLGSSEWNGLRPMRSSRAPALREAWGPRSRRSALSSCPEHSWCSSRTESSSSRAKACARTSASPGTAASDARGPKRDAIEAVVPNERGGSSVRRRRGRPPWHGSALRPGVLRASRELLDLAVRRVELAEAQLVQLLAALPQLDGLVESCVAALQSLDDLLELALCV